MNPSSDFFLHSRFHWDFHKNQLSPSEWNSLSDCYEKWLSDQYQNYCYTEKIPKIFHQIWLGNSPLPTKLKRLSKTWLKHNPDFKYILWTESNIDKLPLINKDIFQNLVNPGARSDILRYEILYNFGGIYIDTDFECIRTLDKQLLTSSFLGCIQFCDTPQIGNAILMAEPYSRVVRKIIDTCTLPQEESVQSIIDCTGPNMLTKAVLDNFPLDPSSVLLLPSDYFYPWPSFLRDLPLDPHSFTTPYSYGIHHWHTSWIKSPTYLQIILNKIKKSISYYMQ